MLYQLRKQVSWLALCVTSTLFVLTLSAVLAFNAPVAGQEETNQPGALQAVNLDLEPFASGFSQPVEIANAGGTDQRLFVIEREGIIWIVQPNGVKLEPAFLNLTDRVESGGSEQGLLGLVFEPTDSATFYVNYTRKSTNSSQRGDTVIARYQVLTANLNQGDPNSEQIVLVIDQPFANHNAGDMAFGPDDELYIPMGDGGDGGDPNGNAQNLSRLLGKTLRIHVTGVPTYTIPAGNPYANDNNPNTRAEIWSAGWRNPWRFSFDRETGDLYLGDVGQGAWEEIDFEPANSPGLNYGWNRCEGTYVFPAQNPPQKCSTTDNLVEPVFDYDRNQGTTVTGGYVYRGVQYPNMIGHYIFADFGSGNFWSMIRNNQGNWAVIDQGSQAANNPSTFGEDTDGELYVADYGSGIIYHLHDTSVVTATPTATTTPTPTATGTLTPVTPSPTSTLSPTAFPSLTPSGYLPLVHKPE